MFQVIGTKRVYVVDLPELPELPITWTDTPELKPYAEALQKAIEVGTIKEPGKYGIEITPNHEMYMIYQINE